MSARISVLSATAAPLPPPPLEEEGECSPGFALREGILAPEALETLGVELEGLYAGARSGEIELKGRSLWAPKRDEKWEEGRAHDAIHFGVFVAPSGRAEARALESVPELFDSLWAALAASGIDDKGDAPQLAVTVHFYAPGQYSSSLARKPKGGGDFEWPLTLVGVRGSVGCVGGAAQTRPVQAEQSKEAEEEEAEASQQIPPGACLLWNGAEEDHLSILPSAESRLVVTLRRLTPRAAARLAGPASRPARHQRGDTPDKVQVLIPGAPVLVMEEGGGGGDCRRTPTLEAEHVHAVYDTIAKHWSHTRYKAWPKVADFLSERHRHALIADVGCGNGKYLRCTNASRGHVLLGSDVSTPLLEECCRRFQESQGEKVEVVGADAMTLPYRDACFDGAICIAVLHHLSTEPRRLQALREIHRILRPGAEVLVYAWAREQGQESRRRFDHADVLVPWNEGRQHQDEEVPVKAEHAVTDVQGNRILQRYCHVYQEGELEGLFAQLGPMFEVVHSFYDCSNWCVVARRTDVAHGNHRMPPLPEV